MGDILWDDRSALEAAIEKALPDAAVDRLRKKARGVVDDIWEDIEHGLRESMASTIAYAAKGMAERVIEDILAGNEGELRSFLGCVKGGHTGRSDGPRFGPARDIDEQHPVIHGRLFEGNGLKLRRHIVEAHRDLIASERIMDLEDQLASVMAQNLKLTADLERAREELRAYR